MAGVVMGTGEVPIFFYIVCVYTAHVLACRNHIIVDHGPFVENEYRHLLLQKLSYVYNFFHYL